MRNSCLAGHCCSDSWAWLARKFVVSLLCRHGPSQPCQVPGTRCLLLASRPKQLEYNHFVNLIKVSQACLHCAQAQIYTTAHVQAFGTLQSTVKMRMRCNADHAAFPDQASSSGMSALQRQGSSLAAAAANAVLRRLTAESGSAGHSSRPSNTGFWPSRQKQEVSLMEHSAGRIADYFAHASGRKNRHEARATTRPSWLVFSHFLFSLPGACAGLFAIICFFLCFMMPLRQFFEQLLCAVGAGHTRDLSRDHTSKAL